MPRSASTISTRGQQTGRGKAAHRFDIAQATGRQRLVPKAVPVLQQQHAPGVQAVQAHPLRIDQAGPLAAGDPEGVPEQIHRLGAAKLVGKREEKEVEAAGHEIGVDACARVLVKVEPELGPSAPEPGQQARQQKGGDSRNDSKVQRPRERLALRAGHLHEIFEIAQAQSSPAPPRPVRCA